jgi:hypothetical protein
LLVRVIDPLLPPRPAPYLGHTRFRLGDQSVGVFVPNQIGERRFSAYSPQPLLRGLWAAVRRHSVTERCWRSYPAGYSFLTSEAASLGPGSQTGSQRRQESGDAGLSLATIIAAKWHIEPCLAMPRDRAEAPPKRKVR